jgi:hypothetical protein
MDTLDAADAAAFDEHLLVCDECWGIGSRNFAGIGGAALGRLWHGSTHDRVRSSSAGLDELLSRRNHKSAG